MNELSLTDSVGAAVVVSYLVNKLKDSGAAWLSVFSRNNPWVLRTVAAIGASLTAAGFGWSYDAEIGAATITGLTMTSALAFPWAVITQFAMKETWFRVDKAARK